MKRRRVVAALGAAVSTGVAGCLDGLTADNGQPAQGTDSGPADGDETDSDDDGSSESDSEAAGGQWPSDPYSEYDTTAVEVQTPDGEILGEVLAAIAETSDQRYLGLSAAESMPEDGGMLFVYESVADRTFVMREMDFGIDIVYADGEGVITEIHHAEPPGPDEDGNTLRYPGRGQYVLEVTYRWTEARGVEVGDVLQFER